MPPFAPHAHPVGHEFRPAAFNVVTRAIQWIVDTQPTDWWHGGFSNWVAQPPAPSGPGDLRPIEAAVLSRVPPRVFGAVLAAQRALPPV